MSAKAKYDERNYTHINTTPTTQMSVSRGTGLLADNTYIRWGSSEVSDNLDSPQAGIGMTQRDFMVRCAGSNRVSADLSNSNNLTTNNTPSLGDESKLDLNLRESSNLAYLKLE